MNKVLAAVIGLVILTLAVWGVFALTDEPENTGDNQPETTQSEPQTTPETDEETQDEDEQEDESAQSITIDARSFEFSVEEITAAPGETVNITLTNSGGTHDFVIDELDVASRTINTGETDRISFTVPDDAAGQTYAFYCSVNNHRELGMEGQLTVTAQ